MKHLVFPAFVSLVMSLDHAGIGLWRPPELHGLDPDPDILGNFLRTFIWAGPILGGISYWLSRREADDELDLDSEDP